MQALTLKSKYLSTAIFSFCVAAGVILMFPFENFFDQSNDEFFQSICVRRYNEAPLGLLVFWIGHLWSDVFGFSVLNLRILTSIEMIVTMAITSSFLFYKTKNLRLSSLTFLLGCVLLRISNFYIYNWDSGSFIFDAATICILIECIDRPGAGKYFILGVFLALMTLGRVPSGIFLPFALVIVSLSLKGEKIRNLVAPNKQMISLLIIIAGWLLTFIVVTLIILGSPLKYIEIFNSEHFVSGHSILTDRTQLYNRLADMVYQAPTKWFAAIVSLLLAVILPYIKRKWFTISILFVWLIFSYIFANWATTIYPRIDLMLGMDAPLGFGLLLSVPIYNLFAKRISLPYDSCLKLWACGLMALSIAFGSDGFTERITTAFVLPVIYGVLWSVRNKRFHKFLRYALLIPLLTFSFMLIVHYGRLREGVPYLVKTDIYPFHGLMLTPQQAEIRKDLREAILKVRKDNSKYVFVGNHLMSELMTGPDYGPSFQKFHVLLTDHKHWNNFKDTALNKLDALIYIQNEIPDEEQSFIKDLEESGFTVTDTIGQTVIRSKK